MVSIMLSVEDCKVVIDALDLLILSINADGDIDRIGDIAYELVDFLKNVGKE